MRTELRRAMNRHNSRWAHAAKVALGATAVVAAMAVAVALAANLIIVHHLDSTVDTRLADRLTVLSHQTTTPLSTATGGQQSNDLDDAPTFAWLVKPSGTITALSVGAPALPVRHWTTQAVTLTTAGSPFRFEATTSTGGLVVVGESVVRIGQAGDQVLIAEGVLGALLLLVTFVGSFVVGLRASAPIEQIRRRQAEFTADASHELRTPLSVIEAEVDLALSRPRDTDTYRTTLGRISSESGRLRSIVEDLLWLARADGARDDETVEPTEETVDLVALGDACVERFAAVADAASVTLQYQGTTDRTMAIRADHDAIDRLVSVLLDNACKYAGAGGTVDLRVASHGGRVFLTIDDSGPGIPEDHRDLVFDRFHRADDRPGGSGLGLAIADAVVRNSGGTWSVGRSPLGGARMEVSWRLVSTPTAAEPQPVA